MARESVVGLPAIFKEVAPARARVLLFIDDFIKANSFSPLYVEIARAFDNAITVTKRKTEDLERIGMISHEFGIPRSITITKAGERAVCELRKATEGGWK